MQFKEIWKKECKMTSYRSFVCGMRRVRLGRSRQTLFLYDDELYFKSKEKMYCGNGYHHRIFKASTGEEVTLCGLLNDSSLVLPLYPNYEHILCDKETKEVQCLKEPKSICRKLVYTF